MNRHLLSAADLDRDDALLVLDTAAELSALTDRAVKKLPTLRGRTVVTMFYENSTRTRVSFEISGKWMSADVVNVSSGGSSVGKGESLRDTALTLAAGVATWIWSDLKFQADMGVMLTFMFIVNMIAAMIFLPALCRWLLRPREAH